MNAPIITALVRCTAALALSLCSMTLAGCGKTAQTTRYQSTDIQWSASEIAQQWASSDFLAHRSSDSPRIRLWPRDMVNHSSDRLSRSDQRIAVARVLGEVDALLHEKAIDVVWSPEDVALLSRRGITVPPLAAEDQATHILRAEFASMVRAGADDGSGKANQRVDRFFMNYSMVALDTNRIDWAGTVEFARAARGILAD